MLREWVKAFLLALFIVLGVRTFWLEPYSIPTASMAQTLLPGDFILVNKALYGARLPLPFNFYLRMPKVQAPHRNDVVVFNSPLESELPISRRTTFVKRCIALPGDTLTIKNGSYFIDAKPLEEPLTIKHNYHFKINDSILPVQIKNAFFYNEGGRISKNGDYSFGLTAGDLETVKLMGKFETCEIFCDQKDNFSDYTFPHNNNYRWNQDWMGPLYVPKKGDSVSINKKNICFYEQIIQLYEGNSLEVKGDSIFVNKKLSSKYTFKLNYYFMVGDNRPVSFDSRSWGFVPENHIIGKATYLLFSTQTNNNKKNFKRRWFSKVM